jgi:hypothetical protein
LAKSLAGKSVKEAEAILYAPKIEELVSIQMTPFWRQGLSWLFNLPDDTDRIKIQSMLK